MGFEKKNLGMSTCLANDMGNEEKILELHEKKLDMADSLLSGTDVSAKLTVEELMGPLVSE